MTPRIVKIDLSQSELVIDLFNKYRIFYKKESDIELAKEYIQARLSNNESVIFVALNESDDTPLGFTQLYPNYSSLSAVKNWTLNDLYVEELHRKQGIGETLIKSVMDFARENNASFVELSTAVDNYTAQKLYEQIGFEKQQPESGFYTYKIKI